MKGCVQYTTILLLIVVCSLGLAYSQGIMTFPNWTFAVGMMLCLLTITGDLFHYTKVEIDHNEKARTIIYASTAYTLGILSLLLTLTIMIWLISAIVMYGL